MDICQYCAKYTKTKLEFVRLSGKKFKKPLDFPKKLSYNKDVRRFKRTDGGSFFSFSSLRSFHFISFPDIPLR